MKKFVLCALTLMLANPCYAALSGMNQGRKEIKEILNHSYVDSALSQGHPISEIKLVEDTGEYRVYSVSAGSVTMLAKLTYLSSSRCGSRVFSMEWETLPN